jgi:predicted RNase H-like HicB family nuclease
MGPIIVMYRRKDGYWEATCQAVPELVAGDESLDDVKALAHEALRDFLDAGNLEIIDVVEDSAAAFP